MDFFVEEQAAEMHRQIVPRENTDDVKGFLRWDGPTPDMRDYPVAKMHFIFPRALKASQESDISAFVKNGMPHLHHDGTDAFSISKFSRPSMRITQSPMRKVHWLASTKGTGIPRVGRQPFIQSLNELGYLEI
jgi:hypothetical protein